MPFRDLQSTFGIWAFHRFSIPTASKDQKSICDHLLCVTRPHGTFKHVCAFLPTRLAWNWLLNRLTPHVIFKGFPAHSSSQLCLTWLCHFCYHVPAFHIACLRAEHNRYQGSRETQTVLQYINVTTWRGLHHWYLLWTLLSRIPVDWAFRIWDACS